MTVSSWQGTGLSHLAFHWNLPFPSFLLPPLQSLSFSLSYFVSKTCLYQSNPSGLHVPFPRHVRAGSIFSLDPLFHIIHPWLANKSAHVLRPISGSHSSGTGGGPAPLLHSWIWDLVTWMLSLRLNVSAELFTCLQAQGGLFAQSSDLSRAGYKSQGPPEGILGLPN